MCYPSPGPRCSSHAAKTLARAQIACQRVVFDQSLDYDDKRVEIDRLIKRRDNAQLEFNATPAGLEILKQQIASGDTHEQARARLAYREAKALRTKRLRLVKMRDVGEGTKTHGDVRMSTLYGKLGIVEDFDTSTADRVGWQNSSKQFSRTSALLVKASEAWMSRLSPEEVHALQWLTNDGTEVLSRKAHGSPPSSTSKLTPEEVERREALVKSAFGKAPLMPKPVILYRGIGSEVPFDVDQVLQDGEYTAPTVQSATVNPGVANSFGYSNVILEMKTRRFPSPTNFAGNGPREAEVMIAPGSRWKVTGSLKGVSYGWDEDSMVDGYTILQMEEVPA